MLFSSLDANRDSALDIQEFSYFAGDSDSTPTIFEAMDFDGDNYITVKEIEKALQLLQQPATEGTEGFPGGDDITDSQTQPEVTTSPPVNGPTPYNIDGTPLEPNDTTGSDANSIATPETANTTYTPDADDSEASQKVLGLLSGTCISNVHYIMYVKFILETRNHTLCLGLCLM